MAERIDKIPAAGQAVVNVLRTLEEMGQSPYV